LSDDPATTAVEDCTRRIDELYGDELLDEAGVLHVMAVWRAPTGPLVTLTTGAAMPVSHTDPFALRVARARADAIITTGRNLREEPRLTHALASTRAAMPALEQWRRRRLGKTEAPLSVVLTGGDGLDLQHPLFRTAARSVVLTSNAAAARLRSELRGTTVDAVGVEAPSVRAAIDWLRQERKMTSVLIEAGPSTSSQLYAEPTVVDELMLSMHLSPEIDDEARAPEFLDLERVREVLPVERSTRTITEPSGPWRYMRLTRC